MARELSRALHDLMLEGIKYEKATGAYWEQARIEQEAEKGIVRLSEQSVRGAEPREIPLRRHRV